jgi:hypothetical protein
MTDSYHITHTEAVQVEFIVPLQPLPQVQVS